MKWTLCLLSLLSVISVAEQWGSGSGSSSSSSSSSTTVDRLSGLEQQALDAGIRQAQEKLAGMTEAQTKANDALLKYATQAAEAKKAVTEAEKKITEYKTAEGLSSSSSYSSSSSATPAQAAVIKGLEVPLEKAKKEYVDLQAKAVAAQKAIEDLAAEKKALELGGDKADVDSQVKALRTQLNSLTISNRFNTLEGPRLAMGVRLEALERTMDDMIVGAYLREKMARFISSRAICAAKEICDSPKGGEEDKAHEILKDVFFSEDGTLGRERNGKSSPKSASPASAPTHK